jgi:hypothetical protein
MKLIKCKRSILILISLALIFALGVMTSIAQEKQIRDFLKGKVTTPGGQETRKGKTFQYTSKVEMVPIPDTEGHFFGIFVREGVNTYEDGEQGWNKTVIFWDGVKDVGSFVQYTTVTFQDGSTTISHTKGTSASGQFSGEIIHGTGRFQGIKGTATGTFKNLPPAKGEIIGKALSEWTLTYTLPPK